MLFGSIQFLLFFIAVMAITWRSANNTLRKVILLVASYGFYAYWDWRFLSLVAFVTLCAWLSSVVMPRLSTERQRRTTVIVSVALQLAVLGFFKYFNFFTANAVALVRTFGGHVDNPTLAIILPVGLSFYVFHSISYTVDCFKGKVTSKDYSLIDVALYIAFFPQLIAGPIVRGLDFLPQLRRSPEWSSDHAVTALRLFVIGFCYKYLLADNLALIADPVFAAPQQWNAVGLWAGVASYFAQIYFDFAGYSWMAIGCAGLLGYVLPANFNFPYTSLSTTEFWRRWHISLSTWLRDYLFIPLGGSRRGRPRYYANLFITMGLGGLWHGASWNFAAWGLLHGVGLTVHKWITGERPSSATRVAARVGLAAAALIVTQLWVMLLWVFFRAQSFNDSMTILTGMFTLRSAPALKTMEAAAVVLPLFLVALDGAIGRLLQSPARLRRIPDLAYGAGMGLVVALTLFAWAIGNKPFIYFQF
jgi:alginate O-acetyltransferase complex protein AlgI